MRAVMTSAHILESPPERRVSVSSTSISSAFSYFVFSSYARASRRCRRRRRRDSSLLSMTCSRSDLAVVPREMSSNTRDIDSAPKETVSPCSLPPARRLQTTSAETSLSPSLFIFHLSESCCPFRPQSRRCSVRRAGRSERGGRKDREKVRADSTLGMFSAQCVAPWALLLSRLDYVPCEKVFFHETCVLSPAVLARHGAAWRGVARHRPCGYQWPPRPP